MLENFKNQLLPGRNDEKSSSYILLYMLQYSASMFGRLDSKLNIDLGLFSQRTGISLEASSIKLFLGGKL